MQSNQNGGLANSVRKRLHTDLRRVVLWQNIPNEMRQLPQWGMSTLTIRDDGVVDKAPRNYRNQKLLSVKDSAGWATFDEVIATNPPALVFRVTEDDPYVVLDLDLKKIKTENDEKLFAAARDGFVKSTNFVGTYIEYSTSTDPDDIDNTASYHVILKGETGGNRSVGPLDLFRANHAVILTGDIAQSSERDVAEGGARLDSLIRRLPVPKADLVPNGEIQTGAMIMSDEKVLAQMFGAGGVALGDPSKTRGEDARALFQTDFRHLADNIDISSLEMRLAHAIVNYTQNPEQFYRIFSASGLYRGKSGGKSGYTDQESYDNTYLMGHTFKVAMVTWQARRQKELAHSDAVERALEKARDEYKTAVVDNRIMSQDGKRNPLPPIEVPEGLVGEIAKFIYEVGARPLWESSIAAALALFSAYVGRHYNINGTGLNLYILVVAGTGKGKETGPRGAMILFDLIKDRLPQADNFLLGSSLTSGASLHNGLIRPMIGDEDRTLPSKLLIWGEAGKTLQNFTRRELSENMVTLKRSILDCFSKGAWQSRIAPQIYSRAENTLPAISAPNLVLLGDMTPESLSPVLTGDNILDGFVPRFLIVEYRGPRPPLQLDRDTVAPDPDMLRRLQAVVAGVLRMNKNNVMDKIEFDKDALEAYIKYDTAVSDTMDRMDADDKSSAADREIWNRAGLKVLKLAGLIAVGCKPVSPIVRLSHVEWAVSFVERDMQSVRDHMSRNSSVESHEERMRIIKDLIKDYYNADRETRLAAGGVEWQVDRDLIGYGYIRARLNESRVWHENLEVDANGVRNIDNAMDMTLRALTVSGFIIEERHGKFEKFHQSDTGDTRLTERVFRLDRLRLV